MRFVTCVLVRWSLEQRAASIERTASIFFRILPLWVTSIFSFVTMEMSQ